MSARDSWLSVYRNFSSFVEDWLVDSFGSTLMIFFFFFFGGTWDGGVRDFGARLLLRGKTREGA